MMMIMVIDDGDDGNDGDDGEDGDVGGDSDGGDDSDDNGGVNTISSSSFSSFSFSSVLPTPSPAAITCSVEAASAVFLTNSSQAWTVCMLSNLIITLSIELPLF